MHIYLYIMYGLAIWLCQCGAEQIILISRTGELHTGWQQMRYNDLTRYCGGGNITISTTDLGDYDKCLAFFTTFASYYDDNSYKNNSSNEIPASNSNIITNHPSCSKCYLKGIWHVAMILQDMTFAKQTTQAWNNVHYAKYKILDTINQVLQSTTVQYLAEMQRSLDAFVCFSSIVALHGNIGQSAYAHANACCEYIIQERNAKDLIGL